MEKAKEQVPTLKISDEQKRIDLLSDARKHLRDLPRHAVRRKSAILIEQLVAEIEQLRIDRDDIAMMLRRTVHHMPEGYSKDQALAFVCRKCPGNLSREISRTGKSET